jgi:hypothetical protein
LSRVPLRWVMRVSVRSCGAAPICPVASASINRLQHHVQQSAHQLAAVGGA